MKKRLLGFTTYLVGPMEYAQGSCSSWRKNIAYSLREQFGIGSFDPCRKPYDGGKEGPEECKYIDKLKNDHKYDELVTTMKEVVSTDLTMLDKSDFIIAYLDTDQYTCGSFVEITYASIEKKPILIVCKQGKRAIPGFLWGLCGGHSTFFNSFEELLNYLKSINSDEEIDDLNGRWKFFDMKKIFGGQDGS